MSLNLTDRTADGIFQMITSDPALVPGEKLPNEAALCERFGVSRTTVREAVRSLAAQGVLEVRRGRGTYVSSRGGMRSDIGLTGLESVRTRLQDLFEIRLLVEPATAAMAAERGTEAEIAAILRAADAVAGQIAAGGDWSGADLDFHQAFVAASHNQFMQQLIPIINKAIFEAWALTGAHDLLPKTVLRDNELLCDFVKNRDAIGARHAMAVHIRNIMNLLDTGVSSHLSGSCGF
ncbi:MAG: FadR family transcriptional regulator [Clostridia bacterium]|nr:FadR family transcriptional regulator [Clostridia bacterium]